MRKPAAAHRLSVSDVEPTEPKHEKPDATGEERPNWHVHLELRSDELVALHRMGFTSSALAWREGMEEWQPVGQGPGGTTTRRERRSDRPNTVEGTARVVEPKRARADSKPPAQPELVRAPKSGPPPPPPPVARSREQRATDLPPAPNDVPEDARLLTLAQRAISSAPPPPPPPPPVPAPESTRFVSAARPAAVATPVEYTPAQAASSIPPLSLEREASTRPPMERSLWLKLGGIVALSAGIGATVSALLWGARSDFFAAAPESQTPLIGEARPGAASPKPKTESERMSPPCPVGNGSADKGTDRASETPTVSLDTLPLERAGDRGGRALARADSNDAPSARVSSRGRKGRAEAARLSATPEPRAEAPRKAAGPVNRAALAQAASQAASAATSCDSGPRRGRAAVTFAPSGNVMSVTLLQSFGDVAVNGCVLRAFGRVHVPPFTGDPVEVRKTVSW